MESWYRNKKVLVTGHTGFKGTWLCKILSDLGASVYGYSLNPPTCPSLYEIIGLGDVVDGTIGDIRDYDKLSSAVEEFKPEIIFHLAAQSIVKKGYDDPRYTYETNVMGTVNVLECIRNSSFVKNLLNITTDKVYFNREWIWSYRENEELNGFDPYSNSKSCSELVTDSYRNSFLSGKVAVSTARAGNVIGGGDFSPHRIIPDCVRSILSEEAVEIRNPYSTRPYQHVLEALSAYLLIVEKQGKDDGFSGNYNVGPYDSDNVSTGEIVKIFGENWGPDFKWKIHKEEGEKHEANMLSLDCSKIRKVLGWYPKWSATEAISQVCNWTRAWINEEDVNEEMTREIKQYFGET